MPHKNIYLLHTIFIPAKKLRTIFIFEKGCLPLLISLGELPFSGVPNYLCVLCIKTPGRGLAGWPMYTAAAFFLLYGAVFFLD